MQDDISKVINSILHQQLTLDNTSRWVDKVKYYLESKTEEFIKSFTSEQVEDAILNDTPKEPTNNEFELYKDLAASFDVIEDMIVAEILSDQIEFRNKSVTDKKEHSEKKFRRPPAQFLPQEEHRLNIKRFIKEGRGFQARFEERIRSSKENMIHIDEQLRRVELEHIKMINLISKGSAQQMKSFRQKYKDLNVELKLHSEKYIISRPKTPMKLIHASAIRPAYQSTKIDLRSTRINATLYNIQKPKIRSLVRVWEKNWENLPSSIESTYKDAVLRNNQTAQKQTLIEIANRRREVKKYCEKVRANFSPPIKRYPSQSFVEATNPLPNLKERNQLGNLYLNALRRLPRPSHKVEIVNPQEVPRRLSVLVGSHKDYLKESREKRRMPGINKFGASLSHLEPSTANKIIDLVTQRKLKENKILGEEKEADILLRSVKAKIMMIQNDRDD